MQQPSESTVHLLPFMLPVGDDELRGLYQKVKNAMVGVHRNNFKELERLATEWLVLITVHNHYMYPSLIYGLPHSPLLLFTPHSLFLPPCSSLSHVSTLLSNSARQMSGITDRSPAGKSVNNHCNFKMMMWLVIFYEFYDKKVSPSVFC